MKTLTNPTDDDLNREFYVTVCRGMDEIGLRYTQSMDAVLPWLMNAAWFNLSWRTGGRIHCEVQTDSSIEAPSFWVDSDTPAKACVLALLKAHGVEVE